MSECKHHNFELIANAKYQAFKCEECGFVLGSQEANDILAKLESTEQERDELLRQMKELQKNWSLLVLDCANKEAIIASLRGALKEIADSKMGCSGVLARVIAREALSATPSTREGE